MGQLNVYSIQVTSSKSTVTVYTAKPEVGTAAKSTTHKSCIHNLLTFCKSLPVYVYAHTG